MGGGDWRYSWGPQDDQESTRAIHGALDHGINWIDTAPVYGLGHAEEVVGRALSGMPKKPFIATKCGLVWDANGRITDCLKTASVKAELDASLKRLKVDVIDLYQVHWPRHEEAIEEAWETIAASVRAGKIRYAGVSNFNVAQIRRIEPIHPVASLQPPYSMIVPDAERELLPFCASHKIGVVAYSPMQKGLLTGKITRERVLQLPPDDHRSKDPQFREPLLSANLEFVQCLAHIAARKHSTVGQLAIAWVLRRTELTSAIVGARRSAQVDETVGAADLNLTTDDIAEIGQCFDQRSARLRS